MYDAEVPPVYPIDSNALREDNSGPRRSARATKVMAVTVISTSMSFFFCEDYIDGSVHP